VPLGAAKAAPSKVVVVFAFPDEENVVTAQLVATVDYATGAYKVEDTSATVSIPGTSYTMLRDAYPFGGPPFLARDFTALLNAPLRSASGRARERPSDYVSAWRPPRGGTSKCLVV